MNKPKTDSMSAAPPDKPGFDQALTENIERRKDWLNIDRQVEADVTNLAGLIEDNITEIMDRLYDHFQSVKHTRSFFTSEESMQRAKLAQTEYFLRLARGGYDRDYVLNRLEVGRTHYVHGLETRWYLGAYCLVLNMLIDLICEQTTDIKTAKKSMSALTKLIFFDMGLAIDTYNAEKAKAIREHRDAIAELETESRVTRGILESAPLAFVRLTSKFQVYDFNDEFAKLIDHNSARGKLVDSRFFDLLPSLDREIFDKAMTDGTASQVSADLITIGSSREQRFIDWAVWPIRSSKGDTVGLFATFKDVTDSVRLQQQRDDFVATLTHDLKTPILAANRALKLLVDGDFGEVDEEQRDIVETILQSNDAMYEMVLTLLDVYKYDSGTKKLCIVPTNLVDSVSKMANELRPLVESNDQELKLEVPANAREVPCDFDEIRRVIQNLIDNSVKYTPGGGRIALSIVENDQETMVSVSDTGRGIRTEDKPKLFQRFWQASSGGRYYASTGLGLYLCRQIVESHGGRIWCDSEPGRGSTFFFSLPRDDSQSSS